MSLRLADLTEKICCTKVRRAIVLMTLLAIALHAEGQTGIRRQATAAKALAERVIGPRAEAFDLSVAEEGDGGNYFAIKQQGGKICIEGDCENSVAVGLNHYLKHYAKVHVSWLEKEAVELPERLPKVKGEVRRRAEVEERFMLNYCTFGYTMVWWGWEEWEHFIDWMALNGINLVLSQTGQEAVWQEVWREMGLSDEEIGAYFSGPAHLPWHRMGNLDGLGGPLPQSWIESQRELEKKIVGRERELGMTTVMPAFAGHVPQGIAERHGDAEIVRLSPWCGFEPTYFLNPTDPLFAEIQQKFMEKQAALYGSDHVYGCDPFNEMDPPSWEPKYLAEVSRSLYASLEGADSAARCLQMSWVFYYKRKQWTPERLRAYLTAVPQGGMELLDYFCENTEVWRTTAEGTTCDARGRAKGFYGQSFVWCYLGNFGGNTMLVGDIRALDEKLTQALATSGDNLHGVGSTLESFDCSEQTYEFLFERVWQGAGYAEDFAEAWADMRYGKACRQAREAWALLTDSVYRDWSYYGLGSLIAARPDFEGHGTYYTKPYYSYDNETLLRAVRLLMEKPSERKSYSRDVVNLLSQWLGNQFLEVRNAFTQAYKEGDAEKMRAIAQTAQHIANDLDKLLMCEPTSDFASWVRTARQRAEGDKALERYYEKEARTLVTIWGGPVLNDYANRLWSGLVYPYYWMRRWDPFFKAAIRAVEKGEPFDEEAFYAKLGENEKNFAEKTYYLSMRGENKRDALETAREILRQIDDGWYAAEDREREALEEYLQRYPEAALCDVYKWCFQNVYGPAHLGVDSARCAASMSSEMEMVNAEEGNPYYEYCGPDGRYVRVNLRAVKEGKIELGLLAHLVECSAKGGKAMALYDWKGTWQRYEKKLRGLPHPPLNFNADAAEIAEILSTGGYVAHHSRHFNETYNFHYRLVRRDLFDFFLLPALETGK